MQAKFVTPCAYLFVIWLAMSSAGCGPAAPAPDGDGSTDAPSGDDGTGDGTAGVPDDDAVMTAANLDAWVTAVADHHTNDARPTVTYSATEIKQAYEAGEITESEYFELCITTLYDHDSLDVAYRAEPDPTPDPTALLRMLRYRYDSLSPDAQATLLPYVVSFEDPRSAWYDADATKAEDVIGAQARRLNAYDMERPSPDGAYFVITGGTEAQRDQVNTAMNHAYTKFLGLGFEEPTDWIRVVLTPDVGGPNITGDETFHHLAGEVRCHIRLREDRSGDALDATAAHELFHCFQEYVEAGPAVFQAEWVWESSAVWSQEFAYPTTNTEHEYDDLAFRSFHEYIFDTASVLEYASYLYWFFLYQRDGKSGDVVHDLYRAIQTDGTIEAITGRSGFYEEFKEYALWNLNMNPFKFYADTDNAPIRRPYADSIQDARIEFGERYTEPVVLSEGGIMYFLYRVDDAVEKMIIDLTDIQKTDDNLNGIQLVYRTEGAWGHEDVSTRDEVVFCRSREDERVDVVIAIISNGQLDRSEPNSVLSADLVIDTNELCIPQWRGHTECKWEYAGEGEGRGEDILVLGDYTSIGRTRVEETLLYDEDDDRFFAIEQTVSISSDYEWYFEHVPPTVDASYTAWERRVEEKDATRNYVHEIPDGCPFDPCWGLPERIRGYQDDDPTTYTLRKGSFRELGEYLSVYSAYYVPGSLGIMQGHVAEVRTTENEHSVGVSNPPTSFELTMSDDGTRLTGSYQTEGSSCEAEYRYE